MSDYDVKEDFLKSCSDINKTKELKIQLKSFSTINGAVLKHCYLV